MNFKDPISTFAYNLISLHHDIMWYIFIILTLVYWTLYKIIKEYSWSTFNKQEGFLLFFSSNVFIFKIQKFMFYIWANVFIFNILYVFIKLFILLEQQLDFYLLKKKNNKILKSLIVFFLGKAYFLETHYDYNKHVKILSWDNYGEIFLSRFMSYYLFNKTSNALYFYDGFDKTLTNLQFKHSINLEYIFGLFPTVIIGLIIVPSMYLLYSNETDISPSLTVKILGHQWYWSYESNSINYIKGTKETYLLSYNFDSVIINETDLVKGSKRLLETDTSLVLPYNVVIRFLISSSDVLHAWALPEMGIKVDAVPGRLNQVVTIPSALGVYYGQCSELCGVSHGFMPIKVNVITLSNYYNLLINK